MNSLSTLPPPQNLVQASESHFSFTSQAAVVAGSWNSPNKSVDGWLRERANHSSLWKWHPRGRQAGQLIRNKQKWARLLLLLLWYWEFHVGKVCLCAIGWMDHRRAKLISSRDVNSGLISFGCVCVWSTTCGDKFKPCLGVGRLKANSRKETPWRLKVNWRFFIYFLEFTE